MNLDALTQFFGWMTAVNLVLITFSFVVIVFFKKWVCSVHGKLFGLSETEVATALYKVMSIYKILIVTFSFVPYLALKLMSIS